MDDAPQIVRGPNVLVWREVGLYTISMFDAPVLDDAQVLVDCMHDYLKRGITGAAVVDLRELKQLDSGPFLRVSEPMMQHREELSALTRAAAVLHEGGMAAASVSGGMAMYLGNAFPIKVFTDADLAFRWLGLSKQHSIDYERRVEDFRSAPNPLRNCRAYLVDNLLEASLAGCGEALGLSESDLQRELSAAGTSFRTELRTARLEAAQDLLTDSDMSMAQIGEKVGYKKQQNFTDAFRKATGMTPAAWRKQQRAR